MRKAERLDALASVIGRGGVRYRRLLKIVIESGGMYCLTWLILLCLAVTGSTAAHVFLSIIGQLTVRPPLINFLAAYDRSLIPDISLLTGCREYTRRSSSYSYR
jgi:hypothetical protein